MQVRFVHISDIHLGMGFAHASFGKYVGNERRQEIKESLFGVVDYCLEEEIDLLFITGDLYEETSVDLSLLRDLNHKFSSLKMTKVFLLAGNHDPMFRSGSHYDLIDWSDSVTLVPPKMTAYPLRVKGVEFVIHGQSYDEKYGRPLTFLDIPDRKATCPHILLHHGDVGREGPYMPLEPRVFEVYDYIALGHIHKGQIIKNNACYPGSLEPLDFSEEGDHGMVEGVITANGVSFERRAIAKRSFYCNSLQVDGEMSREALYEKILGLIREKGLQNLFRITLSGSRHPDVDLDARGLAQRLMKDAYYVEVVDETLPELNLMEIEKDYEGSLLEAYIQYFKTKDLEDPQVREALYEGVRRMVWGQQ